MQQECTHTPGKAAYIKKETIVPQLSKWVIRHWRTEQRYYVAEMMQDLFGEWLIKRSWGGIGNRRGNSKTIITKSYDDALALLADIEKRRKTRNYVPVLL